MPRPAAPSRTRARTYPRRAWGGSQRAGALMEKLPNPKMSRDTVKLWAQDRVRACARA
jgi:hypothetical protein